MQQAKQGKIPTPINRDELCRLLEGYDSNKKQYLLDGFLYGFKIGFNGILACVNCRNHSSITNLEAEAEELINEEIREGRIEGPFDRPPFHHLHVSPIALRPKSSPGKFRLIHNLSAPYDKSSINGNIAQQDRTVSYESLLTIIDAILNFGTNANLAKSDVKSAFRIIPVHYEDYHLLGFHFKGKFYFDKCLSMGGASSCRIFEQVSTALNWILVKKFGLLTTFHYLDDFCIVEKNFQSCNTALITLQVVFKRLGIPLSKEKTVGPSSKIEFLGISLDARNSIAQIPLDKLQKYADHIASLLACETATQSDLKSVIGQLNWATSILVTGRGFLRRLIDSVLGPHNPQKLIPISDEMRKDLIMWERFLRYHNGRSFITYYETVTSETLNFYTDASFMAAGGVFGSEWYQILYPESWKAKHITFLELYPIIVGAHMFAHKLANKRVVFHTDNYAVMSLVNKCTSPHPKFMPLLRSLVLLALKYNFRFSSKHLPGIQNVTPDLISRLQVTQQLLENGNLRSSPSIIPTSWLPEIWEAQNENY